MGRGHNLNITRLVQSLARLKRSRRSASSPTSGSNYQRISLIPGENVARDQRSAVRGERGKDTSGRRDAAHLRARGRVDDQEVAILRAKPGN